MIIYNETPPPGCVRRRVGDIVRLDNSEEWIVKAINDSSAICVRNGIRKVEIKPLVGKPVTFNAPQTQTVRIGIYRERLCLQAK